VKGAVTQQVQPDVLPSALKTITGTIRVAIRLEVDENGNVTDASFDSAGPSRYFANKSLEAARQWKFKPAQVEGRAVPSVWLLHFQFKQSGINVAPEKTAP
jgi:TonB family protein